MVGVLYINFILVRIIYHNFIQTCSLLQLFVVYFTSKKIKYFVVKVDSMKPISTFKFLRITRILRQVNVPFTISISKYWQFSNSFQGFLRYSSIQNEVICSWQVEKNSTFSRLRNPWSVLILINFKSVFFIEL